MASGSQRSLIQLGVHNTQLNRRMTEVMLCWSMLALAWLFIAADEVAIVQGWHSSEWMELLRPLFAAITDLILYPFYAIFLLAVGWGIVRKDARLRGLAWRYLGAQIVGSVVLVRLGKMLLGRGRPNSELPGQFTGDAWSWTLDASLHSMPSGHTADLVTGAVFLVLFAATPWLRMALLLLAAIGGFSRVAVAAHWPSDVLAGALIGALAAYLVLRLWPPRD